jgi:hypothetical protein
MKTILSLLVCTALTITSAFGQKTFNDANAEKRSVSGYHGVEVSGGIDLYLSQGEESVAVSASDTKYRDKIKTEVKDGILKIWFEHDKGIHIDWNDDRKMKAYVSYKTIDQLGGSGGSDIFVDGTIKTNNLNLRISGGSDFEGKVDVSSLKVSATGGSDVSISGAAKQLDMEASGGSDVEGYGLATDICNVEATGGSDIYITVNKELIAGASGGSDIFYKGNGSVKEMKSSGSSSVKKTSR